MTTTTTKTVPVSELSGASLDWAVLVALYGGHEADNPRHVAHFKELRGGHPLHQDAHFSTNWGHGGPIIEREEMGFAKYGPDGSWKAVIGSTPRGAPYYGPTPLVAAMRCYVASKLGDTVEVPAELLD